MSNRFDPTPHIRTIVEPRGDNTYWAWAEVVCGAHDGFWTKLVYRQWHPEDRMCAAAAKYLNSRLREQFGTEIAWDGEVQQGSRD